MDSDNVFLMYKKIAIISLLICYAIIICFLAFFDYVIDHYTSIILLIAKVETSWVELNFC